MLDGGGEAFSLEIVIEAQRRQIALGMVRLERDNMHTRRRERHGSSTTLLEAATLLGHSSRTNTPDIADAADFSIPELPINPVTNKQRHVRSHTRLHPKSRRLKPKVVSGCRERDANSENRKPSLTQDNTPVMIFEGHCAQ